jgi:hypothetical protein
MQTSLHPSPKSSTAFLIAAAAESRLRDNAPAESVAVMMKSIKFSLLAREA